MKKTNYEKLKEVIAHMDGEKESLIVLYCDNATFTGNWGVIGSGLCLTSAIHCTLDRVVNKKATPAELSAVNILINVIARADLQYNGHFTSIIEECKSKLIELGVDCKHIGE